MIKERIHNAFKHIHFQETGHMYFNSVTGEELTSVTTLLKKYQRPFNQSFWLNKKSKDLNISKRELKKEWERKRLIGVTRGTLLHRYLEHRLARKYPRIKIPDFIDNKKMNELLTYAESFIQDFKGIPIETEIVLGNQFIAGQADLLAQCGSKIILFDFKTDKEIVFDSKYGNMKAPFQSLSDCNWNKYCLQLNCYRTLFEKGTKLTLNDMIIVWFNIKNNDYETFQVPKLNVNSILDGKHSSTHLSTKNINKEV